MLDRSPNARIINSIFWGSSTKQIYCYANSSAGSLINSAYCGITYSHGTPVNSFVLNTSNSAADGPNFTATDGSDWSLQFISPCRDAGVNTYTGVTIPTSDYRGNGRIGNKDMGALEVLYSRWKTDPSDIYTWTSPGNWEQGIHPLHADATGDIVIPYLASSAYAPDVASVNVQTGKYMILEPGAKASIASLTNNGTLQIRSDDTRRSSLITDSYSGNPADINVFLSGGGTEEEDNFKWHYISSPVSSLSASVFTGTTPDLAQYVESRPTLSLMQGWVAYDGYVYSTGLTNGPTFSSLTTGSNGKGYNYFDYFDHNYSFSGMLNTSDVTATLGFSGNATLHGYNLLGNPFMSGLDWDYIVSDVNYPTSTSKGVYFTRDNVQCTYINGVGIPGDVTGIIPPMQGFFTKTYASGNSITLTSAARTHDNIHSYYKGSPAAIPLVRLSLEGADYTDETVLRFDEKAKSGFDYDFDMVKLMPSAARTQIYTALDGINYAINGQPFPDTILRIPVAINITSDGMHTITAAAVRELFWYNVKLIDKFTGITTDLKKTPSYSFAASKGSVTDRFILVVSNSLTAVEKETERQDDFRVYQDGDYINIISRSQRWEGRTGSVTLNDLTGKLTGRYENIMFRTDNIVQVPAPGHKGVVFVTVKSGAMAQTFKAVIR